MELTERRMKVKKEELKKLRKLNATKAMMNRHNRMIHIQKGIYTVHTPGINMEYT